MISERKQIVSENKELKKDFLNEYYRWNTKVNNAASKKEGYAIFSMLQETDRLIDSIQTLLLKYEPADPGSVNEVRTVLADGACGERIRLHLAETFSHLHSFIAHDPVKAKKFNDLKGTNSPESPSWQKTFFGLSDASGAFLVLSGFQELLYDAGIIAFE